MRSACAEELRRASLEAASRLPLDQRIERSHALADAMLAIYASANGLTLEAARRSRQQLRDDARRVARQRRVR